MIQNIIYAKCDSKIDDSQFGFRNALGMRDAIFVLFYSNAADTNKDGYFCLSAYQQLVNNHELRLG